MRHYRRRRRKQENDGAHPVLPVQTKLKVGKPGDRYEREADAMANKVMMMPNEVNGTTMKPILSSTGINMKCAECEKEEHAQMKQIEEEDQIQAKPMVSGAERTQPTGGLEGKLQAQKGLGQPLPDPADQELGSKIGADFGQVKIHTDSDAVQMNQELGARAFTHGNDIYFNKGNYEPESIKGKHLLVHELAHVVQQTGKIHKKENSEAPLTGNPLVGLRRGDGLTWGTWHLRPRVKLLQQKLNEKIASGLAVDGMFGAKTGKALIFFKGLIGVTTSNPFSVPDIQMQFEKTEPDFPAFGDDLEVVDQRTGDALLDNDGPDCFELKAPLKYNLPLIKAFHEFNKEFCIEGKRKIRVTGEWFWVRVGNSEERNRVIQNKKVNISWSMFEVPDKEVTVKSEDPASPTKIAQTFELTAHPELFVDTASLRFFVSRVENHKRLTGKGTIEPIK